MDPMNLDKPLPPLPPPTPASTSATKSNLRPSSDQFSLNFLCPVCSSLASPLHTCSSCHLLSYCSPSCLSTDRLCHSSICSQIASLAPRPSPWHRLAFFFPTASPDPHLIWLRIVSGEDAADDIQRDGIKDLFGMDEVSDQDLDSKMFRDNAQRLRTVMGRIVVLFVKTKEDGDGDGPGEIENEAIKGLTGVEGNDKKWKGPVLVFALKPKGSKEEGFKVRDFEIADFRDVVDVLEIHGPESRVKREKLAVDVCNLPPGKRVQVQMVKCLKAPGSTQNAIGRTAVLSDTQLAAIRENGEYEKVTFGNMIGLPLRMYSLTSAVKEFGSKARASCQSASSPCEVLTHVGVMRWHGMNPNDVSLGFYLKDCPGAAFYLREDGMQLTTMQFDAVFGLSRFIGQGLYDAFDTSTNREDERHWGNSALLWATKERYETFFEKLREKMIEEGRDEWKNAEPF